MRIFRNFVLTTKSGYRLLEIAGGKSGQRRVAHHLTGGVLLRQDTDSATENYRLASVR